MEWDKLLQRYVWNDQTTPYLVPIHKLNQRQANSEIFIYGLFQGIFFAIAAIISLRGGPEGPSSLVTFYGFTVVCASVLFVIMKSYMAALYLSATPLAALAFVFLIGLGSERAAGDTLIVTIILLVLLRYSLRIVALARMYPQFPIVEPGES